MITRTDISNFFDLEAEAAKESWEALMKLPIKDRIRKRKAIDSVFLDRNFRESTDENYVLLKLNISVNLSDFKEGDCLLLHKENTTSGIECAIYSFRGEGTILIEVFPPKMPSELDSYYDTPLVLDKYLVDIRNNVFSRFLCYLPFQDEVFWNKVLFNTKRVSYFHNKTKNKEEVIDSEKYFHLELLPKQREAIINSLSAKKHYLIQGPPGTGKSFVLGFLIIEETLFLKHKVVIIGPNHMAINNTLLQVYKLAKQISFFPKSNIIKVGQLYNRPIVKDDEGNNLISNIHHLNVNLFNSFDGVWVTGLTPHSLYSSRARGLTCDTLIIDEAGQMSIPLALMGMIKAKKVILAGDHKQLPPIISSEEIREEMKQSAFQALMTNNNCTMLDVSFRMCEPICNFVSDLFYEGKVKPMKKGCGDLIICKDSLFSFDHPVVIHHVEDYGEQTSDKESEFIVNTIAEYLKKGMPADEIAVLSPFRAQAANIRRKIRKHSSISEEQAKTLTADTVDKMQGQEREIIFFTFVAGNLDYMTEMAEFLYNPNKLNVAFSRAKSKLIIVGNIDQLKKINSIEFPHIWKMIESKYVIIV